MDLTLLVKSLESGHFVASLAQNATVVTHNRRDFEQVPGLKIVDWSIEQSC